MISDGAKTLIRELLRMLLESSLWTLLFRLNRCWDRRFNTTTCKGYSLAVEHIGAGTGDKQHYDYKRVCVSV